MSPIVKKTFLLVALFSIGGALASTLFNPEAAKGANNIPTDPVPGKNKTPLGKIIVDDKLKPQAGW